MQTSTSSSSPLSTSVWPLEKYARLVVHNDAILQTQNKGGIWKVSEWAKLY